MLLASRGFQVVVSLTDPVTDLLPLAEVLAPVYQLTADGLILEAVRLPQPSGESERVVRRILDNAHGKLANTWREGLIAIARSRGGDLTKNDARNLIRQEAPWSEAITPLEAPLHRLVCLPAAVAATVAALS